MQNFFITEYFDWQLRRESVLDRGVSGILRKLGFRARLRTAQRWDKLVNAMAGRFRPNRILEPGASLRSGVMTNVEQRMNMCHFVSQVLAYNVPGELVELGCNEGKTAVLIAEMMRQYDNSRKLHLYDSFEGLPRAGENDGATFKEGWMATTEQRVYQNFERYGLPVPEVHKGWFDKTLPVSLPKEICFAHLDGDFYESILVSLQYVYPRLSKGAICVVDDYSDPSINPRAWNQLPGVKKACDEFLADKPERMSFVYSGIYPHGFFRKC